MGDHISILTGLSKVVEYYYLSDDGSVDDEWLVAVALRFAEATLVVEVLPDTDEVDLRIVADAFELGRWRDDSRGYDVTNRQPWSTCRNASCPWRWTLTNQQGYSDGVQLELHAEHCQLTMQWIAEGSRLSRADVSPAR